MQKASNSNRHSQPFSTDFAAPLKRYFANIIGGIEYVDEGKGIPILFIHGTLSNSDTWRKIIPDLSKKYRCVAIDLPIGGHSVALERTINLSPVGIAQIIKVFLDYLSIDKVIIVSNDTGGAYAQIFASLYPESIDKLIFSNCEVRDVFPPTKFKYLIPAVKIPGFTFLLSRVFKIKSLLTSDVIMGLLSHKLTNNELSEIYLKSFIENKQVRKNFASNVSTWSPKYTIEAAEKLKHFSFPVLILWGKDDTKLFPLKLGEQLKKIFKNADLVLVPNSRTYIQEDQPEITIREIIRFIEINI